MTHLVGTVAPAESPEDSTTAVVVLVAADGSDVDSARAAIKTRATGLSIAVTIDRQVTLYGAGKMAAVEARGPRGERYIRTPLPITLLDGDRVSVSPGWA